MFPIPTTEKLVETKTCRHCAEKFPITDKDLEFYEKVSPVFGEKKYTIPTPTLCPDCRQQRRLSFRNERKLYKRTCDATRKEIISIYSPDKPSIIYDQDYWWSDKWDPMSYGRDFDFKRGFFEQFTELQLRVPRTALIQKNSENSQYTNDSERNKNCYLCFTSWETENSIYATNIFWSKNCIDCFWSLQCENCYESVNLNKCYNTNYSFYCFDCSNSDYLINCKWSHDCLFSVGLINKRHYFLNKKVEKNIFEEYKNRLKTNKVFLKECLDKLKNLQLKTPRINLNLTRCENCEWDFVSDSSSCKQAYDSLNIKDSKFIFQWWTIFDAFDMSVTWWNEKCSLLYEGLSAAWSNSALFTTDTWNSNHILYSDNCHNSSYFFGCVGVRNKQYCILNEQYTKEEYETLVPKIIEHMKKAWEWGEFFPSNLSPFGYNETVAAEYFPLTKAEAKKKNFNWSDYEAPFPKVEKIIPASKLPDDITKIPDDILNWAIECEVTKKPFRIIKQELEFYRKHNLPIPRRHPDQRHLDRMALRNPRKLFERKCDKCKTDMLTTYAPERPEIVYCEACYNKEVLG